MMELSNTQDLEMYLNAEIHSNYEIMYHLNPCSLSYYYYKGKMDSLLEVKYMIYYNDEWDECSTRLD